MHGLYRRVLSDREAPEKREVLAVSELEQKQGTRLGPDVDKGLGIGGSGRDDGADLDVGSGS